MQSVNQEDQKKEVFLSNGSLVYLKLILGFLLTATIGLSVGGFNIGGRVTSIENDRFRAPEGRELKIAQVRLEKEVENLEARLLEQSMIHSRMLGALENISVTLRETTVRLTQQEKRDIVPIFVKERFNRIEERLEKSDNRYEKLREQFVEHVRQGRIIESEKRHERKIEPRPIPFHTSKMNYRPWTTTSSASFYPL